MTLNEWEQSNIEVLTSREMGEWLCRRENRLLEQIRDAIEREADYQDANVNADVAKGMYMAIEIIDKQTK